MNLVNIMSQIFTIEKLDHQGRGIIRANGKVIFVENALPGEEVEIQILKEKKNLQEAKVSHYHHTSSNRVRPICPYYTLCGGCHIMHMNYDSSLQWKEDKVKEILKKFMNHDISFLIKPIVASQPFSYRNKVTLQVENKIGYYEKRSNHIVPINHCDLINEKMNQVVNIIANIKLNKCSQVIIRYSEYSNEIMVIFDISTDNYNKKILETLRPFVNTIYIKNKTYECIYGNPYIEEKIGNFIYRISPDSFFQVNTKQAEKLYELVRTYADLDKEDIVLDLYCGTGTIGLFLSPQCKKVFGIEINQQAVEDAQQNQLRNQVNNIEFICDDVAKVIGKIENQYSVVVVDPPRSGLDPKTVSYLKEWKVKCLIYVSCDPVTLARDLKELEEVYEIKELTPVDMFPETYHIECVVKLVRK